MNDRIKFSEYAQFRVERVKEIPHWEDLPAATGANAVAKYWRNVIAKSPEYDDSQEHYAAVFLTGQMRIFGHAMITKGTAVDVDSPPDLSLRAAIIAQPAFVVVVHNHPQDSPKPSMEDMAIYVKLKAASVLLSVPLLDGIVIGEKCKEYPEGFARLSRAKGISAVASKFVKMMADVGMCPPDKVKEATEALQLAEEEEDEPGQPKPRTTHVEIVEADGPELIKALREFLEAKSGNGKRSTLNWDQVMAAVEADSQTGFCKACGHEQQGCEPDARRYKCDNCGEEQVYGAEELLIMFGI